MSNKSQTDQSLTLKGDDALQLWRKGRAAWNEWIAKNSGAYINFGNTNFSHERDNDGDLSFSGYDFGTGGTSFVRAEFGDGDVDFSEATFGGTEVDFSFAKLNSGDLFFTKTRFLASSSFARTDFGIGGLYFEDTFFSGDELEMSLAKIGELFFRPASIELKEINAQGLHVKRLGLFDLSESSSKLELLDLLGSSFEGPLFLKGNLKSVPDLLATRSSNQVELSELKVMLRRKSPFHNWLRHIYKVAVDPEDSVRLRRLKEIAETNKDHQTALRFSADENRARRWQETSFLGSFLDAIFSASSNYGQNILRPFVALILLTLASICLYKTFASELSLTLEKSWGHAITLAASNSLPFLPQSRSLRDDAIKVLYSDAPNLLVDAIMIGQGILSFIFLFLIGLGLRNRFRL
ncbi:hypothetical protein IT893_10875 [Thalassospira sp. A40-3]|uniref:hypothetical protein n=1 Tax=Thalassospira sp. A40-3 TaxID=2785908 RepID=UPI0018CD936C|nr:hypothetical protein [Thalassospira sp. A40-3]QPO10290.1 hypothetical protein IT893_10875 [Thalassospira sp. A40-3]